MPQPITIPRLGWSMEEGVFGEWLKSPGDIIRPGDMLFLLEGEKAATEIEALDAGVLCIPADAPQPGANVKVGDVIGYILTEGETAPTSVHGTSGPQNSSPPLPSQVAAVSSKNDVSTAFPQRSRAAGPAARRLARELGIDLNAVFTPDPTGRVICEDVQRAAALRTNSPATIQPIATPRARRRAREFGIDWTRLAGSGRDGRIRERDVIARSISSPRSAQQPATETPPNEPGRHIPASKLRQIIAGRMSAGVHQPAPVTLTTKVHADALIAYREELKSGLTSASIPSYNDILIHLVARTIREIPSLNACWYQDGIHHYDAIHIATAVDTPEGLLAPVVRNADQLTLNQITDTTQQLITAARSGRLNHSQLTGGSFTISNLGMFGVDAFTPILNLPQAAILGIGRIVEEPVVKNGQLTIGRTMTLSLTFDHRVIDGAPAARWLQRLGERLENPRD